MSAFMTSPPKQFSCLLFPLGSLLLQRVFKPDLKGRNGSLYHSKSHLDQLTTESKTQGAATPPTAREGERERERERADKVVRQED